MRLIDEILSDSNIDRAILQVKRNKGVSGVDKMTVDELDEYFYKHRREIRYSILNKKYKKFAPNVAIPTPTNPILGINRMFNAIFAIPDINLIIKSK